jgi:hypothetical protein
MRGRPAPYRTSATSRTGPKTRGRALRACDITRALCLMAPEMPCPAHPAAEEVGRPYGSTCSNTSGRTEIFPVKGRLWATIITRQTAAAVAKRPTARAAVSLLSLWTIAMANNVQIAWTRMPADLTQFSDDWLMRIRCRRASRASASGVGIMVNVAPRRFMAGHSCVTASSIWRWMRARSRASDSPGKLAARSTTARDLPGCQPPDAALAVPRLLASSNVKR